jgi:type I restriction enzyme, S subunit
MSKLPEGWRMVGLFDVAEIASGQVDPREPTYSEWPLVAPNHIEEGTGRLLPAPTAREQGAISGKYTFSVGDVLYSKIRPYLRKASLAPFSGLCSADMYPLRSKGQIEPGFLLAVLLGTAFTEFAVSVSMRTGIPKVNREELAKFRCGLPPLSEQRKIAGILSSVDDAIEGTQAVIHQLQVVKKAMMTELLTRGLPGRHMQFKQTEIGEVPEEWGVVFLGEVISRGPDNGLYKPHTEYGQGTLVVRIDDFANGDKLTVNGLRRVRVGPDEVRRFRLRPREILINRVNSLSHLAKCVIVGELDEEVIFESNMMRLGIDEDRILPEFAFLVLASPGAKGFFLHRAKQAVAQASVNQQDVKALPLPMPSLEEQEMIYRSFQAVLTREHAENQTLQQIKSVKQALMSVLLTGEVRVTPDEAAP